MNTIIQRFLLLFLLSFFFSNSSAYDRLLNNTSWKCAWQFHQSANHQFWWHSAGDTTIGSIKYVILQHTETITTFVNIVPKRRFVREDSIQRKVFILDTSMTFEKVWYDFGANIGDSVVIASTVNWPTPSKMALRRIDTVITIWGIRRQMHFDSLNPTNYSILIEGVGWNNGEDLRALDPEPYQFAYHDYATGCIYKNRIQQWVSSPYIQQYLCACESMCPSIGLQDLVEVSTNRICPGDSAKLDGPCDTTFYWSTLLNPGIVLDTINSIYVSPTITSTYLRHGSMKIDTVTIIVNQPFTADLGPDTSACTGNPFTLSPIVSDTNVKFHWPDASTNKTYDISSTGQYWVKVRDSQHCYTVNDTLNFVALPLPLVTVDSSKLTFINDAPFLLNTGNPVGGNYYGPGVINGIFNPNAAGKGLHNIAYVYIDSNGCSDTAFMEIVVEDYTTVNSQAKFKSISVYPNPAYDRLFISNLKIETKYLIYNVLGDVIISGQTTQNTWIDVSGLNDGVYFIQLEKYPQTFRFNKIE